MVLNMFNKSKKVAGVCSNICFFFRLLQPENGIFSVEFPIYSSGAQNYRGKCIVPLRHLPSLARNYDSREKVRAVGCRAKAHRSHRKYA
ncbi:hypothetical protein TSAR_010321 [Trichomalopsis sarcophagae]|uniref:Uncharacterized protein n=1 Tax=Trichomalopsis sarcophagae TaxID=543379 RepID=A0A232EZC3_9HYME|nr:hypothetical protein TSAR_010321 [Trichomalopsis sarcophagae]